MEAFSAIKHEYLDGEIYAMAGGTPRHAELAANATAALRQIVKGGPCRVYSSDLRLLCQETGLATYADAVVVCGEVVHDPQDDHAAINPTVIVEVLSPSTEDYDRGIKFEHYRSMPSLKAYLLISQDKINIEVWEPDTETWVQSTYTSVEDSFEIASLGGAVRLTDIYP